MDIVTVMTLIGAALGPLATVLALRPQIRKTNADTQSALAGVERTHAEARLAVATAAERAQDAERKQFDLMVARQDWMEREIGRLQTVIAAQAMEIAAIKTHNAGLGDEVAVLQAENSGLRAENAVLRSQT